MDSSPDLAGRKSTEWTQITVLKPDRWGKNKTTNILNCQDKDSPQPLPLAPSDMCLMQSLIAYPADNLLMRLFPQREHWVQVFS